MHCLAVDITGVSCKAGRVAATIFDRYCEPDKTYILAAMPLLGEHNDPATTQSVLIKEVRPECNKGFERG